MEEDKDWVAQVLMGNKQAYAHLINKYKDKVYALMFRLLRHQQDAQDLTQECFIKAYHYLHSFDPERKFSSWLYRIALNLYFDVKRVQKKKQSNLIEINENQLTDGTNPEGIYLKKEHRAEIQHYIDRLPEAYRIVLLLRYVDNLTYQEISDYLEIPVSTVQVRLHRAKKNLRSLFHQKGKGSELREMF